MCWSFFFRFLDFLLILSPMEKLMYKLNIYQVTQEEVGGIADYEEHEFAI